MRFISDSSVSDDSVQLFSKLGWISVDNILQLRKICMTHKIINGKCSDYNSDRLSYVILYLLFLVILWTTMKTTDFFPVIVSIQ